MRIVIVGSVAAGTSVGAKARRASEDVEIAVYDRDRDVSYSGCGIPFLVGGEVADVEELRPRDAAWFASRYRMDVRTRHDVVAVDHPARTVTVRDLETGEELTDSYDVLVLATGARPVVPDVPGVGLGVCVAKARHVSDGMFLDAARALASKVTEADIAASAVFPQLDTIRDCSHAVACAVIRRAVAEGHADAEVLEDLEHVVREAMWFPEYLPIHHEPAGVPEHAHA